MNTISDMVLFHATITKKQRFIMFEYIRLLSYKCIICWKLKLLVLYLYIYYLKRKSILYIFYSFTYKLIPKQTFILLGILFSISYIIFPINIVQFNIQASCKIAMAHSHGIIWKSSMRESLGSLRTTRKEWCLRPADHGWVDGWVASDHAGPGEAAASWTPG